MTVQDDTVTDVEPAIPDEDASHVVAYPVPMLLTELDVALNAPMS